MGQPPLHRRETENSGVKLSLGRGRGDGEDAFKNHFSFSIPYPDVFGNRLESVGPTMAIWSGLSLALSPLVSL